MKRNLLLSFAVVAALFSTNIYAQNVTADVAGIYNGDLTVVLDGMDLGTTKQNISIIATTDSQVTMELKNFSISSGDDVLEVGDIIVEGIPLEKLGDNTEFKSTDVVIQHEVLGALNINVQGNSVENKIDLLIKVGVVIIQQDVDVTFKGIKTGTSINTITRPSISVYPSPATTELHIDGATVTAYHITSITGVKVASAKLMGNSINVSKLAGGHYIIEMITSEGIVRERFMKK